MPNVLNKSQDNEQKKNPFFMGQNKTRRTQIYGIMVLCPTFGFVSDKIPCALL